jgi:putative photosynthetic complex assembly protein 2
MLEAFVYPALFGLAVWWASTVLIIYLDNLPRPTFKYTLAGTTVLFVAAIAGLAATRDDASIGGVYLAFTCGILAWAWQEVSFYTGYVTGPRRQPCPEGCRGWRHFGHAIQTSLYHELAILASGVLVWWITRDGANQVGKWTFMILWWMHQKARDHRRDRD